MLGGSTPAVFASARRSLDAGSEAMKRMIVRSLLSSGLRNGEHVACQALDCIPVPGWKPTSAR